MAYRIHDDVIRGEIRNDQRNSVSGWLEVLRTEKHENTETEEPSLVMLSFTGNLGGEVEGRNFRLEVRERDQHSLSGIMHLNWMVDSMPAVRNRSVGCRSGSMRLNRRCWLSEKGSGVFFRPLNRRRTHAFRSVAA